MSRVAEELTRPRELFDMSSLTSARGVAERAPRAGTNTRRARRAVNAAFAGAVGKDVVSRTCKVCTRIRFENAWDFALRSGMKHPAADPDMNEKRLAAPGVRMSEVVPACRGASSHEEAAVS